jgi:integrase
LSAHGASEMKKNGKPRARYGTGTLLLRGTIWYAKWREVRRQPDGVPEYIQHSESTGSDDKEFAQRFLNRKLQQIGGRRPTVVDPRKVSYEDLRRNWLVSRQERGMRMLKINRQGNLSHATLPRLDKFFAGYRARDITIDDLRRFRADGHTDGLSDARINRYMATLRGMFNQSLKDELLTRTEVPPYFPMGKESGRARAEAFIEPQFYAPLRKELEEPLRSAFTLAYHDAVRVEEMKRLRWRDFDFERREIYLSEEVTKTDKARIVPIPSDFDLKAGKPDELVCPIGDRRETWNEVCVRVGAGWFECIKCEARCDVRKCPTHGQRAVRGVRYHGPQLRNTRHTAMRSMNDAGMEQTRIMAISGHKTDSMFRRYNIGREKDVQAAREAIERHHKLQQRGVGA